MKYKIGNVEVEAVQWDASSINANKLMNFVGCNSCEGFSDDTLSLFSAGKRVKLLPKNFLVKLDNHFFAMTEYDFERVATKVKEPKFKVGDKVYYFKIEDGYHCFKTLTISEYRGSGQYVVEKDRYDYYYESELFTLEEAIEKLKEL